MKYDFYINIIQQVLYMVRETEWLTPMFISSPRS